MKQNNRIFLILAACCCLHFQVFAQEIALNFPYFSGKNWDLILLRGDAQDTVLRGVIPEDGRVLLRLPETKVRYQGMARWMLREGGGLDMVVNGENFSVECLSAQPNEQNIIYRGSAENTFLRENHREQERLLMQYEAVRMVLEAYPADSPLHEAAKVEKKRLEQAWADFHDQLAASPLYAARFREVVNLTRGIGRGLEQRESEKALEMDDFITRGMRWEALYTSNHWSGIIYSWVQMHTQAIRNDTAFHAGARRILNRIPDPEMYTDFCEFMARFLVRDGRDSLLAALGPDVKNSGRLLRANGVLAQFWALQKGDPAPDLALSGQAERPAAPISIRNLAKKSDAKSVLLIFYQSDCGHCETALEQLTEAYPELRKLGILPVSIAGDTDPATFRKKADTIPWPNKYLDEKGMNGPNFKRYGVAGTPTLLLVGADGRLELRAAGAEEVMAYVRK